MAITDGQPVNASTVNNAFMSRLDDTSTTGSVTVGKNVIKSTEDAIIAHAGGGQGSAYLLTKDLNRISTCATTNDSVKLPSAVQGLQVYILNDGAQTAAVYPATGEQIDGLAANTSVTIPHAQAMIFVCRSTGQWLSQRLVPQTATLPLSGTIATTSDITTALSGYATSSDLTTHTSATTSVHGITDTSNLSYKNAAETFSGLKTHANQVNLTDQSSPSNPPAGQHAIYPKSDGNLYIRNSSGTETAFSAGTGTPDNTTIENASGVLRVKDAGITQAKLATRTTGTSVGAGGVAIASSSGTYNLTGAYATITNQSVTITTTGRPVRAFLTADGASTSYISAITSATGGLTDVYIRVKRGSTVIGEFYTGTRIAGGTSYQTTLYTPPGSIAVIDTPAAGTYTYSVEAFMSSGGAASVVNVKTIVYEL